MENLTSVGVHNSKRVWLHSILKPPSLTYFFRWPCLLFLFLLFYIQVCTDILFLSESVWEFFSTFLKTVCYFILFNFLSCKLSHNCLLMCLISNLFTYSLLVCMYVCVLIHLCTMYVQRLRGPEEGHLKLELKILCVPSWDAGN